MTFYKLTKTAINPKPDRRRKDDWRSQTSVPSGTVFVRAKGLIAPLNQLNAPLSTKDSELALHLAPNLVRIQPKLNHLLKATHSDPALVLRAAVRKKYLDMDDIEEIIKNLPAPALEEAHR